MQQNAPPPSFLYFGDPMCSWCYGFGPVLRDVHDAYPDVPLVCIAGGLRPGPRAEKLDDRLKRFLRREWGQIADVTGQPFGYGILELDDFLYDTEPASRALVVVRRHHSEKTLEFLEAMQTAFYRDGRNITTPDTLGDIYAETGCGPAQEFLAVWSGPDARRETEGDFQFAQSTGMTAFPSLVYAQEGRGQLLCRGYLSSAELLERIASLREAAD